MVTLQETREDTKGDTTRVVVPKFPKEQYTTPKPGSGAIDWHADENGRFC
jgi:hypothetical protein